MMIIETGLGGKLDSTNALGIPMASVITKIGFDHMSILGDTLEQIASEKAGIIKNGSCVVLEAQEESAQKVLQERLEAENILQYHWINEKDIDIARDYELRIPGIHQFENAAAALIAARYVLETLKFSAEKADKYIEYGLENAAWPGRMEILCREPFVMVDGAHNGHGVTALRKSLMEMYPNEKFSFYLAVMADKDYLNMIDEMLPIASDFTTVTLENERAAQADELAQCIQSRGVKVDAVDSVESLIELLKTKQENDKVKNIVFGSLYFVGDVKKYFKNGGFLNEEHTKNI